MWLWLLVIIDAVVTAILSDDPSPVVSLSTIYNFHSEPMRGDILSLLNRSGPLRFRIQTSLQPHPSVSLPFSPITLPPLVFTNTTHPPSRACLYLLPGIELFFLPTPRNMHKGASKRKNEGCSGCVAVFFFLILLFTFDMGWRKKKKGTGTQLFVAQQLKDRKRQN